MASSKTLTIAGGVAVAGVLALYALSSRTHHTQGASDAPSGRAASNAQLPATGPASSGDSPVGSTVYVASGVLPMDLRAGQWAKYAVVQPDGTHLTYAYKVLGASPPKYDFELVMLTPKGKSVMQYTVTVPDRFSAAGITVDKGFIDLPGGLGRLDFTDDLLKPEGHVFVTHVGPLTMPKLDGAVREDVACAAGRFPGATVTDTTIVAQNKTVPVRAWYHPRVPIFGIVRLEGIGGPSLHYELVDLGESGAKSEVEAQDGGVRDGGAGQPGDAGRAK